MPAAKESASKKAKGIKCFLNTSTMINIIIQHPTPKSTFPVRFSRLSQSKNNGSQSWESTSNKKKPHSSGGSKLWGQILLSGGFEEGLSPGCLPQQPFDGRYYTRPLKEKYGRPRKNGLGLSRISTVRMHSAGASLKWERPTRISVLTVPVPNTSLLGRHRLFCH